MKNEGKSFPPIVEIVAMGPVSPDAKNILEIQGKPMKKYAHAAPARGEISGTLQI